MTLQQRKKVEIEGQGMRMLVPIIACAAIALSAYMAMNQLMIKDLIDHLDEREVYKSVIYFGWLLCGFVVFVAFIATAPRWLLVPASLIFFVSLSTNYAYVVISKRPISVDVMEWLPQEMGQLGNAGAEFGPEILWAIVKAAALLGVLLALRVAVRRRQPFAGRLARGRSALLAGTAFLTFHASAIVLQPPQMMAETNVFVFGLPALFATPPQLRRVSAAPARAPLARKVVLVVDESVTYSIYRRIIEPTIAGSDTVDFGEAASIANCSAASNALLRWGVEKTRVGRPGYDPRTNPTIWAYARAAGYRTTLIDGQSKGELQNYVGTGEFSLIDEFIPASDGVDSDSQIAATINAILGRAGPDFVYVVKRGIHFPYEMNYPEGRLPADAPRDEKYALAVSYASNGFFARATSDADFPNTLLIYTSDHGQDLTRRSTHCNPDPSDVEYSVPLAAMTAVPALRDLLGNGDRLRDRASHVNIFATLLYAFGYERGWLETEYGSTLGGPPAPYLVYVSLGWRGPAASVKRQTVDTTQFTESEQFPRRALGK